MIYLDTSVVLAQLLAEDHRPPVSLWDEALVASRLMEYEVWTRLHAQPRPVGLACQLRPPDDHHRPRPGYARLRPGTLLNRATDYGRNEAGDGKALRELLELSQTRGE